MAIATDFSVASNGDIRHVSGSTIYTVRELHEYLQNYADDASPSGDDQLSILSDNPSKLDGPRATDKPMFLNLLGSFNIDDDAAKYINFGSVSQASGGVLYTGLKSIGSPFVSNSPLYVVQNGSKLTVFWANGHIQIMVKAKTGGSLIDSGDVRVYSRKYGQTYADFAANLAAGGEQPVAISTALTDWTTLSKSAALALFGDGVALTFGSTTQDTGDGNGSKEYKGTITISVSTGLGRKPTTTEAAQCLQAVCAEDSTTTLDGLLGWKYRVLGNGSYTYTPNSVAPFGHVAGGKWFVAQGWYVSGASAADSQAYEMVSHDGTRITNPVFAALEIGNLVVGARVVVGRDNGSGGFLTTEYTLNGSHGSGLSAVTVNESIKADTPTSGYLRINGVPFTYTSYNAGTKTFTISGTLGQIFAGGTSAWVPFIDKDAASATESSAAFTFSSNFTARVKARKGASPGSKKPFETTFAVTSGGGSTNVILDSDE